MVLLIVGIKEGSDIARSLVQQGFAIKVLPMNRLCREQMAELGLHQCLLGQECLNGPEAFIEQARQARVIIDASSETSTSVQKLYADSREPAAYIRYYREELEIPPQSLVSTVHSMAEAVNRAVELGAANIFLTTGSHGLDLFINEPRLKDARKVARVLPEWKIIKKIQDWGLPPQDIVAMQGPFSTRINKALFRMYNADLIISRDSGKMGGADTKLAAALELNIAIIIIKRKVSGEYLTACGMQELLERMVGFKEE